MVKIASYQLPWCSKACSLTFRAIYILVLSAAIRPTDMVLFSILSIPPRKAAIVELARFHFVSLRKIYFVQSV